MDEHVPFAITRALRARGADVLIVQDERRELELIAGASEPAEMRDQLIHLPLRICDAQARNCDRDQALTGSHHLP